MLRRSCFATLLAVELLLGSTRASTVMPGQGAGASANRIAIENALPGDPPSQWDINNSGSPSIQGFAAQMSVRGGESVDFKIRTSSTDYRIDIYRMGYYQGNGARRVTTILPSASLPQLQPDCLADPSVGLIDCGNWSVSASWQVPLDATSGIYFARLVRQDAPNQGKSSHIYFVVRDDEGHSDVLFQTSDTTWQAYNSWGGASLYRDELFNLTTHRALKVSYNRPFNTRSDIGGLGKRSFLFNAEYPLVRWLEKNGYDVSYTTGVDTDQRGSELLDHLVFLSVGHDEYWSQDQRANVEAARDAGVNLAFFSGNSIFWKTRWEESIDGSHTPARTLVCYKETHANAKIDPTPGVWTGTWRDPRFSPPNDGCKPENALKGTLFTVNGPRADSIVVPSKFASLRFWRDTSVAVLPPGNCLTLSSGTLGHEWEEDLDNGFRPPGLVRLSETTLDVGSQYLADHGSHFGSGTATHAATLYRHSSGALVFSAGTIQWSWGLDGTHDRGPSRPDPRMQQATVNVLADMGAQPATLDCALTPETSSTDTAPPVSAITDPLPGAVIPSCAAYTVHGAAFDVGGGAIGAVEVSVDGGAAWHPADGLEQWTYTWMPDLPGPAQIACRAVDDSGNIEAMPFTTDVVRSTMPDCPQTLFAVDMRPRLADCVDLIPIEMGIKFKTKVGGRVLGVRFYKGQANPGIYQVHLWTENGQLLATANCADGSSSHWQEVLFASPVHVLPDVTYLASYHAPGGTHPADPKAHAQEFRCGNLRALAEDVNCSNGVFAYGPSSFPTEGSVATDYAVDVVFAADP